MLAVVYPHSTAKRRRSAWESACSKPYRKPRRHRDLAEPEVGRLLGWVHPGEGRPFGLAERPRRRAILGMSGPRGFDPPPDLVVVEAREVAERSGEPERLQVLARGYA